MRKFCVCPLTGFWCVYVPKRGKENACVRDVYYAKPIGFSGKMLHAFYAPGSAKHFSVFLQVMYFLRATADLQRIGSTNLLGEDPHSTF